MASNKVRFEVFKRDKFQCQYCGRTPPGIVLELDHIMPRSKGGKDIVENYLTSCFQCNRGKGKKLLTDLPKSMDTKLAELKEKRLQLKEFNRFLQHRENSINSQIDELESQFTKQFENYSFNDTFRNGSLKRLCYCLPAIKIQEALAIAISHFPEDKERTILYFCGICWNWIKKPETRDW
jgi:hypothetical protein